jgi:hypothetical protein
MHNQARQLSSPKNIVSPSARFKLDASSLSPTRWMAPPKSSGHAGKLRDKLEKTLKQLNDKVYKPLGKGKAQVARRAAREHIRNSSNAPANPWVERPPSVLWNSLTESWTLHDIALFEACFTLYGKDFVSIQQIVSSKTIHEIVDFFYVWKMTSHYRVWKHNVTRTNTERMAAAAEAKAAAAENGYPKPSGASNLPLTQFWGDGKSRKNKDSKGSQKRSRSSSSGKNASKRSKKKRTKTKGGVVLARLHGIEIKPEALQKAVNARGGIDMVRKDRKWQLVRVDLKLQQTSSSGHTLNKAYERYFGI